MTEEFSLVGVDPETGLPEPITLSREALREAIKENPDFVIESLRDVVKGGGRKPRPVLPLNTPITDMVGPDKAGMLSPAARKLTKADLMALAGWEGRKNAKDLGLEVKDIQTIRDVFSDQLRPTAPQEAGIFDDITISCCCCTPCCCASAEMEPVRSLA